MSPIPDYDLGTARGRIEVDASSLGRAEQSFKSLGRGMIAMGGLAVAGFGYAVKSAADFEKIISAVGAITGATGKDLDALREKALTLATGSIFSAGQIATAFEDLGKAGITIPEILGGAADAVVHLAHAAGDELPGGIAQGAEIVANAMKTFEVSADQAEHFADVLVAAAASSTLSVDDMATSFRYAGPIAHELGLSIDDLSTVLAILGDRGIKGSTAGTSLRGVLLSLTPTSKKAASQMRELGLITEDGSNKFYDLQGNLKPIPEVMKILGDATKDLSEQQKVQAFNTIFQRRAMNAALILAEQGAEGFNKYASAIAKLDASTIAAKKLDNLSGDITILKNTVQALIIRIGEPFQEMLRGWVQGITKVVTWLGKLDPQLVSKIVLFTAIGGAVLIAAGSFLYMVGVAIKLYRTFKEIQEAIKLVSGVIRLLTASFLTNPVTLFIIALIALGAALFLAYKRSEAFRERVDKALSALKPIFQTVMGWVTNFRETFQKLWDVLWGTSSEEPPAGKVIGQLVQTAGPLQKVVKVIQEFARIAVQAFDYFAQHILPVLWDFSITVGKAIGTAISWLINTGIPSIVRFGRAVVDQIGKAVRWLDENVGPVFSAVAELIGAVIDRIVRTIRFLWPVFKATAQIIGVAMKQIWSIIQTVVKIIQILWKNFGDNIIRYIQLAWNAVKSIVAAALQIIRGIIQVVTGIISGDWGKVWQGIKNIFGGIWNAIVAYLKYALGLIKEAIAFVIDLIITIWQAGWELVKSGLTATWELIKSIVQIGITYVHDMISNVLGLIVNIWQSIWSTITSTLSSIWETIKGVVTTGIQGIIGFFSEAPGAILNALGDLAGALWNFFTAAMQKALDGIREIMHDILHFFSRIPGELLKALGDVGKILYDAGKKIIGGFLDGIKSAMNGVKNFVGGIAGGLAKIKGPENYDKKVLIPNGRWLMEGFLRGIENGMPAIERYMRSIAPTMSTTIAASTPAGAGAVQNGAGGAGSSTTNSSVNVVFDMSNSRFGSSPGTVQRAVTDGAILAKINRAVKTGVGTN